MGTVLDPPFSFPLSPFHAGRQVSYTEDTEYSEYSEYLMEHWKGRREERLERPSARLYAIWARFAICNYVLHTTASCARATGKLLKIPIPSILRVSSILKPRLSLISTSVLTASSCHIHLVS